MPKYIKADSFFLDFPEIRDYEYESQEYEVDVVKVVRCKDCSHNRGSDNDSWCEVYECRKSKDGFCDEGVKKENGTEED